MKKIHAIPYSKLIETVGQPGWEQQKGNMVTKEFPFPMFAGGKNIEALTGHVLIVDSVIDALDEIHALYGDAEIVKNKLNQWAGCYAYRKIKGTGDWYSTHSWALSVDYLPNYGPWMGRPLTPYHVVQAFKKRGFLWGGDWQNTPDGMHFSGVTEGK